MTFWTPWSKRLLSMRSDAESAERDFRFLLAKKKRISFFIIFQHLKLCENKIISMSLAWNKENIWVPNKMRTYDLPYTRRALSIHFKLLRTHEERGHILDLKLFWTLYVLKSFFADVSVSKTSIFPHFAELSILVLTASDSLKHK